MIRDLTAANEIMDKYFNGNSKIDTDNTSSETIMDRCRMAQIEMIQGYLPGMDRRDRRRAGETIDELNEGLPQWWNISFDLNNGQFNA